jgi:hypothetical protein
MSPRPLEIHVPVLFSMVMLGCATSGPRDYVSSRQVSVPSHSDQADRLWEAAQETLRHHRFQLDRVDRRRGVVTTMPVVSKHFFELWRHDVETWPDFWEATLNPIRRWIEVTLAPDSDQAWTELSVTVHKERLSSPDRQFNSTGAAYQFFGDSLPSTTGLMRVTQEDDRWLHLGRDRAMEDYLLRAILSRARIEVR